MWGGAVHAQLFPGHELGQFKFKERFSDYLLEHSTSLLLLLVRSIEVDQILLLLEE